MFSKIASNLLTTIMMTGLLALPLISTIESSNDQIKAVIENDLHHEDSLADIFYKEEQLTCMDKNIYFEARGESKKGWKAVYDVTINRVNDPRWPDTICGVVYQGLAANDGMDPQFSWTPDEPTDFAYRNTPLFHEISASVRLWDAIGTLNTDANHYARKEIRRVWMSSMSDRGTIGAHKFYYAK